MMDWQFLGIAFFTIFIALSILLFIWWLFSDGLYDYIVRNRAMKAKRNGEIAPVITKRYKSNYDGDDKWTELER